MVTGFLHLTNFKPGIFAKSVDLSEVCDGNANTRSFHVVERRGHRDEIVRTEIIHAEDYWHGKAEAAAARALARKWAKESGII